MKKTNKTTLLPAALLVYLAVMAYVGRSHLKAGNYTFYFGVLGASLLIIAILYWVLRKRDKIRQERDKRISESYTTYNEDDNQEKESETKM